MANVKLTCPFPDCDYDTGDGNEVIAAAALLNAHAMTHQQKPVGHPNADSSKQRPPSMERPCISFDSTAEDWQIFLRKWQLFKRGTSLPDDQITSHLWQYCESSLGDALFQQIDDPTKIIPRRVAVLYGRVEELLNCVINRIISSALLCLGVVRVAFSFLAGVKPRRTRNRVLGR